MKSLLVILLAGTLGCSNIPKGADGAVYDLATQEPIEGAELTVHRSVDDTAIAPLMLSSKRDGSFAIEKEKGTRITHIVARAGGYYPAVGVLRGRIHLQPVPVGAQPMRSVEYVVKLDKKDVGLRLADGAIVPADEADVIVEVRSSKLPWAQKVLVSAKGGSKRIVSEMPHGIALEPLIAFENIVEVPRRGYTTSRDKGTWDYGWGAYSTYAVRTPDRARYAKLLVAGFPDEGGESAHVVVRYRVSAPMLPLFVATTPERRG
jgi:hypothetical protein